MGVWECESMGVMAEREGIRGCEHTEKARE